MQDNGQIARAFGAWQKAHQKLCEAENRLLVATDAWKQGRQPKPDALQDEVLALKAEQDWRYDAAAAALRNRRATGAVPVGVSAVRRTGLGGAPAAHAA